MHWVQNLTVIISFQLVTAQKQNKESMQDCFQLPSPPPMDMIHELLYLRVINLLMHTCMDMYNTMQQSARSPLESRETHAITASLLQL